MKTITKYWFLEGFDIFKKLSKKHLMEISASLTMVNIDKGEKISLVMDAKDNVYFLKNGSLKIISNEEKVKYIVKKGEIFGEIGHDTSIGSDSEYAVALEDAILCYFDKEQMDYYLNKYGSLKNELLKLYGIRIRKLERRLEDLLYKDSATRIREFLQEYLTHFGKEISEGTWEAKNLLTHNEIANLTSTSRQTVSNELSKLRKQKSITYDHKRIVGSIVAITGKD